MKKTGYKRTNRIGEIFGKLKVVSYPNENIKNERKKALCKCECGNYIEVEESSLVSGNTKSCGCLKTETNKAKGDGRTFEKLYRVYYGIKGRCNSKTDSNYKNYGARGIKISKAWSNSSDVFKKWALGNGYRDGLQIDRKNNNGHYYPSNCRWVTRKQHSNNQRKTILIEYKGETKPITQWAIDLDVPVRQLRSRYCEQKMSFEQAIKKHALHTERRKLKINDNRNIHRRAAG